MLTAGFRCAPEILPMNKMMAMTVSAGAVAAAVWLITPGKTWLIMPPPTAASSRKKVPARRLLPTSWWPPMPGAGGTLTPVPLRTYALDLTSHGPQKHPPNRVKGSGPALVEEAEIPRPLYRHAA